MARDHLRLAGDRLSDRLKSRQPAAPQWFGFATVIFVLVCANPLPGLAAPIVGGESRANVTIIDCNIEVDGTTTCAVSKGQASVCARRTGGAIRRSFRSYDYLPVPPGCTLGVGYWRDRGEGGSSAYDDTWDRIGADGGKTPFFNSGRSYTDLFNSAGDDSPYDQLARIFIAAELNLLNGSALPADIETAYDEAGAFLISQGPTLDGETAKKFRQLARILEDFVAGNAGPGQCVANTEPVTPDDVGKIIIGVVSEDNGRIVAVEPGRTAGEGIVEITPGGAGDLFILADEPFTIADVRKGKFTQDFNDCTNVDTGEQVTTTVGGNPDFPQLATPDFQNRTRQLRIMIALNEAEEEAAVAPAAAPPGPATEPTTAPPSGTAPTPPSDVGSFPSPPLPPTEEASGGGGIGRVQVPDVIGFTEAPARAEIVAVGLFVSSVTFAQHLEGEDGLKLFKPAFANVEPTVKETIPGPGTDVELNTGVALIMTLPAADMPEPASLPMFAVALALIAFLLWWRRRQARESA